MRREDGFSLLEMLVAVAIMLAVTASVFGLMNPAQGSFQTQPEVSDLQQRLRVAKDSLAKDLIMAGGGAYQGQMSGSLLYTFAPILPLRRGTTNDDPPATYRDDLITLMYVPATVAQTSLSTQGPSQTSAEVGVNPEPGCPTTGTDKDPLCGFKIGMTVMIYDESGNYDVFTITNVQDNALHLQHNNDSLTYTAYDANTTKIVQTAYYEYYLKSDDATGTYQLMFYDGGLDPDIPVVDNVVGLKFDYYGDPQPPTMVKPLSDSFGPWTTYGPKPAAIPFGSFGAGENCIFFNDGSPTPAPRLATLGAAGTGLVPLTAAELTDGPWCPNDTSPNRWDADLLRIRKIGVTLRVQAALAALRGPASVLFAHGGTSLESSKWVPDEEVRFQVTPRNMNLGR